MSRQPRPRAEPSGGGHAHRFRGQHAGLSRSAVLATALELVDREGLAALTMRRLGAELGVEAMAIYHHVPNKEALLDGLVEVVVGGAVPPQEQVVDWQDLLRRYAHGLRATLQAHPDVMPLVLTRPAITPEVLRLLEQAVRALGEGGFSPTRSLQVVYATIGFVIGTVGTEGGPDAEANAERVRRLAAVDLEDFPALLAAVTASAGQDDAAGGDLFHVALEALLVGFATQPSAGED